MTFSRRALLAGAPAAAALAVLTACQRGGAQRLVDVRKFGAKGDGATDDSRAICAAAAALRSNSALYFPSGTYRFALRRPHGGAAILIKGLSNIAVLFEQDAELFMDNLDPATRTGTSHAVLIQGPASRISVQNAKIRWSAGAKRSLGDGIRVMGSPAYGTETAVGWKGPVAPVDRIAVTDCVVSGSPQAGVVMLGVSDITVAGLRAADTGADGLHFNACRRARVHDYTAVNTGDDGLALVTYFAPRFSFDDAADTFSFPALTEWSNTDFTISNVTVERSKANGIRIAGADRVGIDNLTVREARTGSAVMVDSAEPGTAVGWNYVASRGVRVDDVTASNCDIGIHVLARSGAAGDRRFTDFDVHLRDARLGDCTNWAVQAESLTEHRLTGFRAAKCSISSSSTTGGNGGVGIRNADGISLGEVSIRHSESVVTLKAVNAAKLAVSHVGVTIDKSGQPAENPPPCVTLENIQGVIDDMAIKWSAAPDSWIPVRLSPAAPCGGDLSHAPLAIRSLKVVPAVSNSANCT